MYWPKRHTEKLSIRELAFHKTERGSDAFSDEGVTLLSVSEYKFLVYKENYGAASVGE